MKDLLDLLTPGKHTKGIGTRHCEKIKRRDGEYESLVAVNTRSISSENTPEEIREFYNEPRTLLSDIENQEQFAKAVLEKAGLPTDWNVKATHDDKINTGTAVYFAAESLCFAFILKKALNEDDTKTAVYNALRFQSAIDKLFIKHWERATRVGEKQLNSNTDSHKKHYDDDHAEWERIAKERYFDKSVPKCEKTQSKLIEYVTEQCGLSSTSSVKKQFKGLVEKFKSTG